MSLRLLKEDLLLDVLGLAHKYDFGDLERSISDYLKVSVGCCLQNFCIKISSFDSRSSIIFNSSAVG